MSNVEIGLTVAVVVLFVGLLLVWRMAYCSRVDCAAIMTKAVFAEGSVKGQWNRIESVEKAFARLNDCGLKDAKRLDDLLAEYARLKAELAQFIKLANGSEQKRDARLAAVESQVAGMQVSREVLTPAETTKGPNAERFWKAVESNLQPAEEFLAGLDPISRSSMRRAMAMYGPPSGVAPLPEPTFTATAYVDGGHAATDFDLTAPDADPETAEAQPQPDDDQVTAVNDVQAVEERFESLGYVAKESA